MRSSKLYRSTSPYPLHETNQSDEPAGCTCQTYEKGQQAEKEFGSRVLLVDFNGNQEKDSANHGSAYREKQPHPPFEIARTEGHLRSVSSRRWRSPLRGGVRLDEIGIPVSPTSYTIIPPRRSFPFSVKRLSAYFLKLLPLRCGLERLWA
jgi:hypothetical protein